MKRKNKKLSLFKEVIVIVIIGILTFYNTTSANTNGNSSLNIELIKVVPHDENFYPIPDSYGFTRSLPPLKIKSTAGKDYVIIPAYKPKIFRLSTLEEIHINNIYLEPYEVREYSFIGYPYVLNSKFYWIAPNKFSNSVKCDCYELRERKDSSLEFYNLWSINLLNLDEVASEKNFLLTSFYKNYVLLRIDSRLALFDLNSKNIEWVKEYEYSYLISHISIVNIKIAITVHYEGPNLESVISGVDLKTGDILWQQPFSDYVRYGIIPLNIYASISQNEKSHISEIIMEPNCFLTFFSRFSGYKRIIRCMNLYNGQIIFEKSLPYSEQIMFPISGYQIFDSDFPIYDNKIFFTLIDTSSNIPIMYSINLIYPHKIETYLLEEVENINFTSSFTSPISVGEALISWIGKEYFEGGAIVIIDKNDCNIRKYIDIDETFINPSNPLKYGKIVVVNTEESIYFYKVVF